MNEPQSLFSDRAFTDQLEASIAMAIQQALYDRLPVKSVEAAWLCRMHGVNHRFDVTRCGQDVRSDRINLFTDGHGNVVSIYLG